MSVSARLKELLDQSEVVYEQPLSPTPETATKTVIVNADGLLRMAVLPVDCELDLAHLKFITRSENIRLATPDELNEAFPDFEVDAIPPFGNLLGLPVFCDSRLEYNASIEFNAGTHDDKIRVSFKEFKRLASPTMIDLVDHHSHAA